MFDEPFPILSIPDLARSLGFYRDLLGGKVTNQFPADGEPAYVAVQLGRSHLGIGRQNESGGGGRHPRQHPGLRSLTPAS